MYQWIRGGRGSLPPGTINSTLVKCCCCLFGELRGGKKICYLTLKLFRFTSSRACPFWAVKHFRPKLQRWQRRHHPLLSFSPSCILLPHLLPKQSHLFTFLPLSVPREIITADAMQGGGGSGREGFLFGHKKPTASLAFPLLFVFICNTRPPKVPNHPLSLSLLPISSYVLITDLRGSSVHGWSVSGSEYL